MGFSRPGRKCKNSPHLFSCSYFKGLGGGQFARFMLKIEENLGGIGGIKNKGTTFALLWEIEKNWTIIDIRGCLVCFLSVVSSCFDTVQQ